jgi:hypothetical protein
MVIRCLTVPQPRALALAAWTSELAPSTRPLVSLESKALRMPAQWSLRVLATFRPTAAAQGCRQRYCQMTAAPANAVISARS